MTETYSWARTGRGGIGGRLPAQPVPAGLHWDEWIGPAAYRDYQEKLHPKLWRSWWEFGDGSVGDWGCHNLDGVFMALKLGTPDHRGGPRTDRRQRRALSAAPTSSAGTSRRGATCRRSKCIGTTVSKGTIEALAKLDENEPVGEHNRPPIVAEIEKKYGRKLTDGGAIFVGDKGILVTGNYCESPRLVPEEKQKSFPVPPKTLPRVKKGLTHYTDFLRACKEGGVPPSSHFDYGGPLTEIVLLGCLAERAGVGKHVEWDAEKVEVTNLPELNRLVRREYRKGWELG